MLKQNEKKIRIRLTIALVVFATVCLRGLVKLTCNLSTYWFVSDILESVFYIVFIVIGVFCLISSIVLYKRRKEN